MCTTSSLALTFRRTGQVLFPCDGSSLEHFKDNLARVTASKKSFCAAIIATGAKVIVYESGAFGGSLTRAARGQESLARDFTPRRPRSTIFGSCLRYRESESRESYIQRAPLTVPTTLRCVLSLQSQIHHVNRDLLLLPRESNGHCMYGDARLNVMWMDAGSVIDPSILFPRNRTYHVFKGQVVFISWDPQSASDDSAKGSMKLPCDIFSDNHQLRNYLSLGIKPSILNVAGRGSAFFRSGCIVSCVAVEKSGVYADLEFNAITHFRQLIFSPTSCHHYGMGGCA
jgi:hypothetical protein